jgi:hypothetical protein
MVLTVVLMLALLSAQHSDQSLVSFFLSGSSKLFQVVVTSNPTKKSSSATNARPEDAADPRCAPSAEDLNVLSVKKESSETRVAHHHP